MNTKTPLLFRSIRSIRSILCGVSALVCALGANLASAQVPQITSVSPTAGTIGDAITISGQNFGANASDNTVWFGAVQANVQTASPSSLSVIVPSGATFAPITVAANGLIGSSAVQFNPTFASSATFDTNSLQSTFALSTGSVPGSSAIVDLDGDGKPDYAVMSVSGSGTMVSIFRNVGTSGALGAASFAPRVDIIVAPSGDSWLAVKDIDGDGKPDLVFSSHDIGVVSVMRNISTPGTLNAASFETRVDFPTGPGPEGLKLGDIDGDGRIDIVVPNYGNNTVSVLRNIGTPGAVTTNSFAAKADFTIASGAFAVALGDVDGDGKLDIVAPADAAGVVSILRNTSVAGTVSFATNVDFATGARPLNANVADLDGDGKADVFVANYYGGSISVFKNLSTPGLISLAPKFDIATATGGSPHSVAVADIDGDGKPDMLTETEGPDGMIVYRNVGTNGNLTAGSFASPLIFATGSNPWLTTVGDVDADGRPDVFVANNYSGTVSVYKNILPGNVPSIVAQPQSVTTAVGSNATFSTTAAGASPLTYQWLLNGAPVTGATANSFTVSNPQLSDNGSSYSVVVTNSYGSATSAVAVLTVGQAPMIQTQPQSQIVLAGTNITLDVAVASGSVAYQWMFNGVVIPNATNSDLQLQNVQVSAAGTYSVIVDNAFGSTVSSNAVVTVTLAPSITQQPQSQTVASGGNAMFSVAVANANPSLPAINSGTLRLWLNAETGVVTNNAGQVTQWQDQSGNYNHAVQSNSSQQPVLVRPAAINNHAAIRFDGVQSLSSGDFLQGTNDVGIPDAFTSFVVAEFAGTTGSLGNVPALIGVPGTTGAARAYSLMNGQMYFATWADDYSSGFSVPTGTYRIWTERFNTNKTFAEFFDRSSTTSSNFNWTTSGVLAPGIGYYVGGLGSQTRNFAGDVAEVIYYRGSLSEADRTAVEDYLRQKYYQTSVNGGISYQWQFNGTNIAGATNASMTVSNIQTANVGNYTVVVCNNNGCTISAGATLSMGSVAGCAAPPSGLIGWWTGDASTADGVGTNNGQFVGTAAYTNGEVAQAFKFNGSSSYVTIPDSASLRLNSISLSGWFEFDRSSGTQVLVSKTAATGTSDSYALYMINGSLNAVIGDTVGTANTLTYALNPFPGTWYHIAYTFDGATLQQALYVNGVLRSSGNAGKAIGYDSHPVLIGAEIENQVVSYFMAGAVDELTMFNRGLTSNEVQSVYAAGPSGICKTLAITSQPQSQTIFVGGSGSLSVGATGAAPVTYQWYKDGGALSQGTNAVLPFANAQLSDAGSYNVVVTDPSGSITSAVATVTVTQAITIFNENFEPGIHSNLWSSFGGLVIATNYGGYVSPVNSGWFGGDGSRFATTVPMNTIASGNISFNLRIANGSAFPWEMADLPGEGIVLEYSINAGSTWTTIGTYNTSAYFSWTNIQTPIPVGAQSATTLFRWRQLSNSGASFDHWALDDIQIATGTTAAAPGITSQPQSQTVSQGAAVSFSVTASGTAPLNYQWSKDGATIAGATGSSYSIANVQPTNIGNYTVVVTNAYGTATSSGATLSITGVPSSIWQGLIAYYPFSGDANDASGYGNNGNATNVTYNTDRFGQPGAAADFSAGNAYVEVPTLNAMPYSPVTYSVWFKLNRYPTAAEQRSDGYSVMTLAGRDLSGSQSQGTLCVFNQTTAGTTEDLQYYTGATAVTSHRTAPTNVWMQLVFTQDASNNATFYINGQFVDTSVFTAAQNLVAPFRIGGSDTFGGGRLSFLGEIDDVRIYNRALTSNDVTQLFASEAPATLYVPTIQNQPQSVSQAIGTDAIFTVTATGLSPLSYQWQFNNSDIAGATNSSLTVTNVQPANMGTYDVIVCNGSSCTNSSDATLAVGTAPSIAADPQSQHVLEGTNVSFTVTANGSSPLSYQWLFNGAPISAATDSVLNLPNVQVANAGTYAVVITNAFGATTSSPTTLLVDALPTILTQPQSQSIISGGTATFSVSANPILPNVSSGTLRMWLKADAGVVTNAAGVVTWQDQSGNTNDATAPTVATEPSIVYPAALGGRPAIRFDGIRDNVNGDYLHGTNDVGIPNAYTSFTVYNVFQTTNTENMMCAVGYPGRYYGECRINGINAGRVSYSGWADDYTSTFTIPTNTYRIWTDRVDTNLSQVEIFDTSATSGTNFQFSTSQFSTPAAGFFIGGLDPSWQYVVNGRNFNGDFAEILFYRGKLTEPDRLAVEQYLKAKYLQGGAAGGYTYQWQFNGVDIPGATNSNLVISNAQSVDAGNYDVVICNASACITSSNATLTVNVPPSITQQPVSQSVIVGSSVSFSATATGTAPLMYQWQHNGANIPGATNASLSIAAVQQSDAGVYALVVTSPYGTATSSNATLSVETSMLVVANVSGSGSSTVQVPVSLIALGTENAVGFSLNFDPTLLSITDVTLGAGASGATIFYNTNQQSSGHVGIVVSFTSGGTFPAGTQEVAVVTFNVGIVATNMVTPITFGDSPTARQVSDSLANSLPATFIDGALTLGQTVFEGDVSPRPSGDQRVTITDWVEVGRFVAGLDTPSSDSEFQRADCAPRDTLGNGKLTVSDWVQAGRYAVGLDPLTPVGGPTTANGNAILQPRTPTSRTITLQTAATSGTTNVVSVQLNSQGNESAIGFSLSFDSQLVRFTGATLGSGAAGASMNVNSSQAANGSIGVALELPFGQTFPTGTEEVVRLSFVPAAYSPGTSNLTFTDTPIIREVSDATANVLTASYVDNTLTTTGLLPSLTIAQDGAGNVTLSWPAAANGYGLESVSDLNAGWLPVSANAVTNGASVFVTQPASTNQLYFRLRHP